MKKILKWAIVVLFAAFFVIQFIRPDYSNPSVNTSDTLEATTEVPDNVRQIFARSCNDCHSNQTAYPWYSNVAPLSWRIVDHIKQGRRHLNFSIWNTYELKKKREKLDEICDQMTDGIMPLDQYLWLHYDAKVSPEEIKSVCAWTAQERDRLAAQGTTN